MNEKNSVVKRLGKALFASGCLNIILLAFLFYWMIKETPPRPYCEHKPATIQEKQIPLASDHTNEQFLRYFYKLPFEQLISKLNNEQLVDNGYKQRDLALSVLVSKYHFDLARALKTTSQQIQTRTFQFKKNKSKLVPITLYRDLTEEQYLAIQQFASIEKWPLTSEGLFRSLKKSKSADEELTKAIFLTQEFLEIAALFSRAEIVPSRQDLLHLITESSWETLHQFAEQQRASQDLSSARRQSFLLDMIAKGSKQAASLLLKSDFSFACRKLDDNQAILLLELLSEKSPEAEQFALTMVTSPRSDVLWQLAAKKLYYFAGESCPQENIHHIALQRFAPKPTLKPPKPVLAQAPKPKEAILKPATKREADRLYLVQEGDSLWKISRRFKVDLELLKKYNKLQSDFLKPGTPLRVPLG